MYIKCRRCYLTSRAERCAITCTAELCRIRWTECSVTVLQLLLTSASSWRPRTTSATHYSGRSSVKTCHAPSWPPHVQPTCRCWPVPSPSSFTTALASASSYWTSVTSWESGLDCTQTTVDCRTSVIVVLLCDWILTSTINWLTNSHLVT